jgi:outer membrane lipoprotein SlyB
MKLRSLGFTAVAAGALALSGCATYPYDTYSTYDQPRVVYERPVPVAPVYGPTYGPRTEYGVVENIELYRDGSNAPIGIGTILGGVAGGVLGHQIGSGRGNTAATIAGAVGGAVAGNAIERSNAHDRYRVVVRLDSGGTLAVSDVGEGELRIGDRVRVVNGRVYRM